MTLQKQLEEIVLSSLKGTPYELKRLTYGVSGGEGHLEVVVDRVEPISLDDIVEVTGLISKALDKADPIDIPYSLDVSSLGAEKPIDVDKLGSYVGRYVNLHLSHPWKGENIIEGTLLEVKENVVVEFFDKGRRKEASFPGCDVDKARLAIKF